MLSILLGYLFIAYEVKLDDMYDPKPVVISTTDRKDQIHDLVIVRQCYYTYGFEFRSKRQESRWKHIRELFNYEPVEKNFPLNMDLKITSSVGKDVVNVSIYDGVVRSASFGSEQIEFEIGRVDLMPGNYEVKLSINSLKKELNEVDANFFVRHLHKVKCKDGHIDAIRRYLAK
jgi:hypothetical protein